MRNVFVFLFAVLSATVMAAGPDDFLASYAEQAKQAEY